MNNHTLYFELFSITLLLVFGGLLLLQGLPGWGLIAIASILASCSVLLRQIKREHVTTTNPTST